MVAEVSKLIRRGLDRSYQDTDLELSTVRGSIDLTQTLRLHSKNSRRLHCSFDELSHDVLHNQIIKATLKRLAAYPTLDAELVREVRARIQRMNDVGDIRLTKSLFSKVALHRNNAHYQLLLKVAELVFESLLPDPSGKGFMFHDVLRDEAKMARVFEDFVRNFYSREQQKFRVEPLLIHWDARRRGGAFGRLPNMRVDVFLTSPDRHMIIDTKYYLHALQSYHGTDSFHSGNLYQLFSYLRNAAVTHAELSSVEGMLLYPGNGRSFRETFEIHGHSVCIATVDLAAKWPVVSSQLLDLLHFSSDLQA
jgi:5-methylcytosine-specific restriction enzyme subunit McrC